MKEIIEDIINQDFNNYNDDYNLKTYNLNTKQLDTNKLFSYFKENNLLPYLLKKISEIKLEYLYISECHGKNHNLRVMIYTLYLSNILKLSDIDKEIVMNAAIYHDIGRINDNIDDNHGKRSANNIIKVIPNNYKDLNMLKAIIELHSIDDNYFNEIALKYNIKDLKRFKILYSILKDADALDRVRLSYKSNNSSLNISYLRLNETLSLIKAAHQLNEYFIKNYDL